METIIQYQTTEYILPLDWSSDLLSTLTLPSGRSVKLLPFQKSNSRWYVRFSSSETGTAFLSINTKKVNVTVRKYKGNNPLYRHGPVIRLSGNTYLSHVDGTPFFYLADTWWFAMTNRMSLREMKTLIADRRKKGFTVVQCVIGGAPEVSLFSSETANAGGLPFTQDHRINPKYFDEVDQKIQCIVESGLVVCIFGSWGHHIDIVGVEGMKALWREILARYASYPVIFSLTGEADVFLGYKEGKTEKQNVLSKKTFRSLLKRRIPKIWRLARRIKHELHAYQISRQERILLAKRITSWGTVAEWIKNNDPYNRILTAHPHRKVRSSFLFHNPSWLDVDSIQSGHSDDSVEFMISSVEEAARENIPVINLEPWYEGILGNFGSRHQRFAFWASILSGACGHSYGAHGVWQMAAGDNFMGHWGSSDWKQAYMLDGSQELGYAKQFLSSLPWWRLKNAASLITHTGSKRLEKQPLAGAVDGKYCIIYVPDKTAISNLRVDFPDKPSQIRQTWYDPRTMKPVKEQKKETIDSILVISAV